MHVLIIFVLIIGLVLSRIYSSTLEEGFNEINSTGSTGSTGSIDLIDSTGTTGSTGSTGSTRDSEIQFEQRPLYDGVW
jgi:hypothetical protein